MCRRRGLREGRFVCNMRELQPRGENKLSVRKRVVRQQQLQRLRHSPERRGDQKRSLSGDDIAHMTTLISNGSSGEEKKNIGRASRRWEMGRRAQAPRSRLAGFDGMSRLGVGESEWYSLNAAAADRSTTRSLRQGRGTRVRGYKPGDGPGLQMRYVPPSTSVPGIWAGQAAVRLAGGPTMQGPGRDTPWPSSARIHKVVAPPASNIAAAMMILWHLLFTRRRHRL